MTFPEQSRGTCDFCCRAASLPYSFAAEDFELPEYGYRSVGEWRACEACHILVNEGRWEEIQADAMAEFLRRQPDADLAKSERFINDLHKAFRRHRIGSKSRD